MRKDKIKAEDMIKRLKKIERIELVNDADTIRVPVDIYWPHPMVSESPAFEHKCHKIEMMEFPNLLSLDNEKLLKYLSDKFIDPYTKKTQVAKVSIVYNEWLYPEKMILILSSPRRVEALTADALESTYKDEVLDK